MEKQLLKQSGIIAVVITFILLAIWFGFSKISLGAYNEKNLTKQFLGEDSEVFKTLVIEVGTSGVARIIAGTTSMSRTGTSSYPTQPRIEFNVATGQWSFKNASGTETVAFGTVSAGYVAAEIGSSAANYVLKNSGSSTGQLATNATLAGSTTIGTGSTITAGGAPFSGTKVGYLANVNQDIGSHFTTVEGTALNHAHTGTDSVQINHTNLTNKGTQTHPQIDTFIAKEGQANGLATTNATNRVVQNPASASTTPGTSTIPMTGTNSTKIDDAFLSDNVTKLGTPSTSVVPEGSNLYHTTGRVNTLIGNSSILSPQGTPRITLTSPAAGQFLKIVDTQGNTVNGTSSMSVGWDGLTGPATGSAYVSSIPGENKIPFSTNGNLDNWIKSLPTLVFSGTTTTNPSVGNILFVEVGTSSTQIGTNTANPTIVVGTLSGGVVTDAGNNGNVGANCFDGNINSAYQKQGIPSWIKYNMGAGSSAAINTIVIHGSPSVDPEGFQYLGSNNDSSWTLLYSGTHDTGAVWQTFTFSNDTAYQYHKLDIISTSHLQDWREFAEIGFLRRTYPVVMDACTTYTLKYLDDAKNLRFSIYSPGTRTTEASRVSFLTGNFGVGVATVTANFHATGTVRLSSFGAGAVQSDANGNLSVSSDERLKDIQGKFAAGITELLGINPILYKNKKESGLETENIYAGFTAQNVITHIPEAVGKNSSGYYTFNDRPIVAALVNSVKELQGEIGELKTKIGVGECKMRYIIIGIIFVIVAFGILRGI